MSLKIIGVGLGRTGTLSTQYALNELGYNCYHMMEVMKKDNRNHLDFWLKVAESPEGISHNWEEVFQDFDATVDYPGTCVWKELIATYPDAKVLLTHHPKGPEGWYKSNIETLYRNETMWEPKILGLFIPIVKKMKNMTSKLVWSRFLKGSMEDKTAAINRYNEHTQEIKNQIPPDKLLIFSVDQGWEPLCKFLGKEIPHTAFPNVNDKATMKKKQRMLALFVRVLIALLVIIGVAMIWRLMN